MNIKKKQNSEVESISTRVKNTKKEIEHLKNELEHMLNNAIPTNIPNINFEKTVSEIEKTLPPKPITIQTDRHLKPTIEKNVQPPNISPGTKPKKYNQAEAREYIKKQKEKRAEQLRAQINVVDSKVSLRKDRLKELNQKALELVSKNVQMKRERSKSREPPIRLDKANPHYKSVENVKMAMGPAKTQDVSAAPRVNSRSRSRLAAPAQSRSRSKSQDCNKNGAQLKPPCKDKKSKSPSKNKAVESVRETLPGALNRQKSSNNYLQVPKVQTGENMDKTVFPVSDGVDLNRNITVEAENEMASNNKDKPKSVLEFAVMTDNCLKDTKETQTNTNNFDALAWMQPPKALQYPYNFINTVKKKLQNAISSPNSYTDLRNLDLHTPEAKSKEEIKEMLIKSAKSNLRSFASHKGPNLDLRGIEGLDLAPKTVDQSNAKNGTFSKNLFSAYDSESDTSKNIPDISTESLGTSHSKPLSLSRLKDLTLKKSSPRDDRTSDVRKSLQRDSYSSDFQKESLSSTAISEISDASINTILSEKRTIHSKQSSNDDDSIISSNVGKNSRSNKDFYIVNSNAHLKSLSLKEPSISLSIATKSDNSPNQVLTNSITFRSDARIKNLQNSQSQGSGDSKTFKSLLTGDGSSKSATKSISEDVRERISNSKNGDSFNLKEPKVSLVSHDVARSEVKNITVRPSQSTNSANQIHLKFEAEVRLLNEFNESFKQFVDAEKAFENLKNKNESNFSITKILQNVDTQTSIITKTSTNVSAEKSRESRNSAINYSRGSEIDDELNTSVFSNNRDSLKSLQNFSFPTDWNLSRLNESSQTNLSLEDETRSEISVANIENCNNALSLNMFDHLIKDEDTRIQQLKVIVKIREQALLDRTKIELVWLEIQRKHLKETGKIQEASLLKKKQRGILIKHEQERNEIKKLKQMQKKVSEHRKNTLKQQRKLMKSQLSTNNMLSNITVKKREERRSIGPLRVVQSCSESVHSEASTSVKSSGVEEILSVTSKSLRISETSELDVSKEELHVSNAKRSLLMRETALQKRRKTAEELLQWHLNLLDEERKISELEAAAASVVKQASEGYNDKQKFNTKHIKRLWKNMTGSGDKKIVEGELNVMSHVSKRQHAAKNDIQPIEVETKKSSEDDTYSSAFEFESVGENVNSQDEKTQISSISELIDNFSRIEDKISTLSKKSEDRVSLEDVQKSSQSQHSVTLNHAPEPAREDIETTISETSNKHVTEETSKHVTEEISNKDVTKEEPIVLEPSGTITEQLSDVSVSQDVSEKISDEFVSLDEDVETVKDEQVTGDVASNVDINKTVLIEPVSVLEDTQVTDEITEKDEVASLEISKLSPEVPTSKEEVATMLEEELTEGSTKPNTQEEIEDDLIVPQDHDSDKPINDVTFIAEKREESVSEQLDDKQPTSPTSQVVDDENSENVDQKTDSVTTIEEQSDVTNQQNLTTEEDKSTERSNELLDLREALESAFKIEESLSKLNKQLSSASASPSKDTSIEEAFSPTSPKSEQSGLEEEPKTPKKAVNQIDVKKRVSQILADASVSRGDKSPRLQDLYVTAYDVGATLSSPERKETNETERQLPTDIFGTEAEELWRKQLAIEQEIKQIELQQKEQIPYVFMREIPNKPPPPYTPPSSLSSLPLSILPSDAKEISEVASYSSKVLYKAYQNNNLDKVKFSENGFKLFSKLDVTKMCAEYMFNVCRDIVKEHYKQFETVEAPSWLCSTQKPQLLRIKPADASGLEKMLNQKLKELFGFKKTHVAESAIIKWGRKKKDHVDEVLVVESQEEEQQWTNFDQDELIVKNQVTEEIMRMLLEETTNVFVKILSKKSVVD